MAITQTLLDTGLSAAADTMIAAGASALAELLDAPVTFEVSAIETLGSLGPPDAEDSVIIRVTFEGDFEADSYFVLATEDARQFSAMLTEGSGLEESDLFAEGGLLAILEAVGDFAARSAEALGASLGQRIESGEAVRHDPTETSPGDESDRVVVFTGRIGEGLSATFRWQMREDQAEDIAARLQDAAGGGASPDRAAPPEPTVNPQPAPVETPAAAPSSAYGAIDAVEVPVTVELGTATPTIGELLELGEGSVLKLDQSVGDNVAMLVSGTVIARGDIVVVEGKLGFRVSTVVLDEK